MEELRLSGDPCEFNYTTDDLSEIGGNAAGAANVVAFNGGAGIDFLSTADASFRANSIHSNAGLGIDLGSDGVTYNDLGDIDGGPNYRQNFPVIVSVVPGPSSVTIDGTLNSVLSESFEIQFFRSSACDASGHGEGEIYLGYTTASTDAGGNASFSPTFPVTVPAGAFITATATRLEGVGVTTSEFSACFEVGGHDSPIFADGFESGNVTGWSSASGV